MRRVLLVVLLIVASIISLPVACRLVGERAVTARLNSIRGVTVRRVWASSDLIPDWFYAKIDVAGAPSAFLYRLTRRSISENNDGFCFFQVGAYAVRYTAYGSFWGPGFKPQPTLSNAFCFDGSGSVSHGLDLFPPRIRGVREFVANIGVVEQTLAGWPKCPGFNELVGANGRYRVCTNPDVSTDIWPPEYGREK
jgi:hypothetical protein